MAWALPAGELAACAGVSAATASGHLAAMREAGLLDAKQQGRHRYYRLASAQVAALLESLMLVAAQNPARVSSHVDPLLQAGRTCYSHLAGRLGVSICDGLLARGALHIEDDLAHFTPRGLALLDDFGLDTRALRRQPVKQDLHRLERAPPSSERPRRRGSVPPARRNWAWVRHHLDSRAVSVTKAGAKGSRLSFGSAFTATI